MNIDDEFRDLAPLRPRSDPHRWERMVRAVEDAAAPELRRRARRSVPGPLMLLAEWTRPAVPAALAIAAAAATLLLRGPAPAERETAGVAGVLGYPEPVAVWMETDVPPSVEDLVFALEGGSR